MKHILTPNQIADKEILECIGCTFKPIVREGTESFIISIPDKKSFLGVSYPLSFVAIRVKEFSVDNIKVIMSENIWAWSFSIECAERKAFPGIPLMF